MIIFNCSSIVLIYLAQTHRQLKYDIRADYYVVTKRVKTIESYTDALCKFSLFHHLRPFVTLMLTAVKGVSTSYAMIMMPKSEKETCLVCIFIYKRL